MQQFREHVEALIKDHVQDVSLLETPPDEDMGDFAYPCFSLAKEYKKAPNAIAEELAQKIQPNEMVHKIEVKGAYLNFFITKTVIAKSILERIWQEKEQFGRKKSTGKKVLVEYPGPNTNKPLHLGHVRNMVLGKALIGVLEAAGHTVLPININNDRGVHICKSMLAYQKWGEGDTPEKSQMKSDFFVGKYYVLFAQKAKENPDLEKEALAMIEKWEAGDKETVELWKKMNDWAFAGFNETYKTFEIVFEKQYYESNTYAQGREMVLQGLKEGIFEKDDKGSIVVDVTKEGFGKKVLLRSNGTTVYMTQDMYLAKKRWEDYHFDECIYVVATEQNYHFQVLFKVFEKLELPFSHKCYHFAYGMVNLTSGKMKSREGTVVDADMLVDDVKKLAKEAIQERHKNVDEQEVQKRTHQIAMAALRFYLLKQEVHKDITFNPKESISFEGETGPYVQYAYVRCAALVRKAKNEVNIDINDNINFKLFNTKQEYQLMRLLSQYETIVEEAALHFKPNHIARFALDLAQSFNEFYHESKVIFEDEEVSKARLLLVWCVKQVLANALHILAIDAPEEM